MQQPPNLGALMQPPGQSQMTTPTEGVGQQQQLAQLQQLMQAAPGMMQKLQDPQILAQAAQRLAMQMPAPPPLPQGGIEGMTSPIGAPGAENAVGLPQGQAQPIQGLNMPVTSPVGGGPLPESLAVANNGRQQAQGFFGNPEAPQPAPPGPQGAMPPGMNPYLQQLLSGAFRPGGIPR